MIFIILSVSPSPLETNSTRVFILGLFISTTADVEMNSRWKKLKTKIEKTKQKKIKNGNKNTNALIKKRKEN